MPTSPKRSFPTILVIPAGLIALLVLIVAANLFTQAGRRMTSIANRSSMMQGGAVAPSIEPMPGRGAYDGEYDMMAYEEGVKRADMFGLTVPSYNETAGVTAAEVDQKVIKTGYLDMSVVDVGESVSKITAIAAGKGGYIQDSSVSEREDGTHYGSITLRVPSDVFEEATTEVKALAEVVKTESANGQDVTEQYTDLEAQLRSAEAQEAQYLEILKKADDVEDILAVQSYLSGVQSTIASLKGRIQYLENVTSYSTLSISLSEEPSVQVPTKEFRPGATAQAAFQTLVRVAQNMAEVLIILAIVGGGMLIPSIVVLAVIAFITKKILEKVLN